MKPPDAPSKHPPTPPHHQPHFEESKLYRHILPTQANWLELDRLSNFSVERCWFPDALLTHVYHAHAKNQPLDKRLFVRTLVLRQPAKTESEGMAALAQLAASELPTAFNTLEQAIGDSRYARTATNHIFFRLLAPVTITLAKLEQAIAALLPQHAAMLNRNLLYTGISRAKALLVLVGTRRALNEAVNNTRSARRYTMLAERVDDREFAPPVTRHMDG